MRKKTIELKNNPMLQMNLVGKVMSKLREDGREDDRTIFRKKINQLRGFEEVLTESQRYYRIVITDDNS